MGTALAVVGWRWGVAGLACCAAATNARSRSPHTTAVAVDIRGCDFSGKNLSSKVLSGVRMQVRHGAGEAALLRRRGALCTACACGWPPPPKPRVPSLPTRCNTPCPPCHAHACRAATSPAASWWACSLRGRRRRAPSCAAWMPLMPIASPPPLMAQTWRWGCVMRGLGGWGEACAGGWHRGATSPAPACGPAAVCTAHAVPQLPPPQGRAASLPLLHTRAGGPV